MTKKFDLTITENMNTLDLETNHLSGKLYFVKTDQIIDSITGKLFVLPASTIFYPGHGDDGELSVSISEYEIYKSKNVHSQTFGDIFWLKS